MPEETISDQGTEFKGELFTELCKSLNINKLRTSPYRPSTNGMVERYHRTLNQMLEKDVSETERTWDLHLPAAAAAYRASENVVTGFTGNFMMLGREVRASVDLILGAPAGEEEFWTSSHKFVADAQPKYRKAYAIAWASLSGQASRRKDVYDRKVVRRKFSIGQWVWYFYSRIYKGRSTKWSKMYVGSMLIVDVFSATNVNIQKSRINKSRVVHVDKLKDCREETSKSWLPVEMNDNTATASEGDGENQDDGVVGDQPNELDDALIVDESAGPSSGQPNDQIADENGDNDGRQPEQLVENTAWDQAAV